MKIAIIGSSMVDLTTYTDILPAEGETCEARRFHIGYGGKGANQAIAAARLGAEVMMVSAVGEDVFSHGIIHHLKKNGVDTRYVKSVKGAHSDVAPIFVSSNAANCILTIQDAGKQLTPQDIADSAESLKRCQLIVLQLESPLPTVYYAINFGQQHNIPVILNPAPASRKLEIGYASLCDFIIPNETELEILSGMPINTKEDAIVAGGTLLDKGVNNLIVTLGRNGALWLSHKGVYHVTPPAVNAVDTSGAGDAFIGCFSYFYLETKNIKKSIDYATLYATCSVQGRGTASSYLDAAQFNKFVIHHTQGNSDDKIRVWHK
ncbi:ribokinase [Serratia liquefaciens]|uniref:ribokinase n=1 Tax=Serratia liquefaciens TaxID=614 RepID=UPI00101F726E|nr:ribokinase [Serratia liquefaciens]RYM64493.1 ribokinase [Serratia liquefaciens]